jgi:hypothetical protein
MIDKNKKKELAKRNRVWYNMNTGTITHKDKKHKSRRENKKDLKKMLDKEEY